MKIKIEVEIPDETLDRLEAARKHRMATSLALAMRNDNMSIGEHRRLRILAEDAYFHYKKLYQPTLDAVDQAFRAARDKVVRECVPPDVMKDTLIHPDHHSIAKANDENDRTSDDEWDTKIRRVLLEKI